MKTHTYHITGMHCNACSILIEDIVLEVITGAQVSIIMREKIITIETPEEMSP